MVANVCLKVFMGFIINYLLFTLVFFCLVYFNTKGFFLEEVFHFYVLKLNKIVL